MELRWLRSFVEVASVLNYRKASVALHLSQPAVSQHIRQLEASVGVQLVERTTRSTRLTRAGEAFLPHAERALAAVDDARAAAQNSVRDDQGIVRVGFAGAMAAPVAASLATLVRSRHPRIELRFSAQLGSRQVSDLVVSGGLEIGFAGTHSSAPGVRSRPLLSDPFVVLAPAAHPLAEAGAVALSALADEDFVFVAAESGLSIRDEAIALCAAAGLDPRIVMEGPDTATAFAFVAAGIGLTVAPRSFVSDIPGTAVIVITDVARAFTTELLWRDDAAFGALRLVLAAIDEAMEQQR